MKKCFTQYSSRWKATVWACFCCVFCFFLLASHSFADQEKTSSVRLSADSAQSDLVPQSCSTNPELFFDEPSDSPSGTVRSSFTTEQEARVTVLGKNRPDAATLSMLASLAELRKNLESRRTLLLQGIQNCASETSCQNLRVELSALDRQRAELASDFERLATGIEDETSTKKEKKPFKLQDELAALLEPTVRELKEISEPARRKNELRERIELYSHEADLAGQAVDRLHDLLAINNQSEIQAYLHKLLPLWQDKEKRQRHRADLAKMDLAKLTANDQPLLQSTQNVFRDFFKNRGIYLLLALASAFVVFLLFRLLSQLIFFFLRNEKNETRSLRHRLLDLLLKFSTLIAVIGTIVLVFYLAEDWFLLSIAMLFLLGMAWTIRLTLPKVAQQIRLILNMGAVREGERLVYQGVAWKLESINFFCKLYNPDLDIRLRVPIKQMFDLVSRSSSPDESWFPCKKGDWLLLPWHLPAIVASLSHEQVELIELGGRRLFYQTPDFLALALAKLSEGFLLQVRLRFNRDLQNEILYEIPATLKSYLMRKLNEMHWHTQCRELTVEFLQVHPLSLDLMVSVVCEGALAPHYLRLERGINAWSLACATENNWPLALPKITVQRKARENYEGKNA